MPRSQRQMPDIYFGQPGRLVKLPYPVGGMERSAERQTYDFLTGSGLHQVSSLTESSRPYTLSWAALHQDTFTLLEQFRLGANGPGPWVLIDPSAPNLLSVNVAAATGLMNDATDFTVPGVTSGVLGSNPLPAFIHRATGWRSLRWLFSDSTVATTPTISLRPMFRNWFGIPVVPGLSYSFSSWMRVDGTIETSASIGMRLQWIDAAGANLSVSQYAPAAVTSTWSRGSVTGVAPVGAAYVSPQWYMTGSTMAVGGSAYIDEPLLEQDSVVNDWAPGTGVRPVQITNLPEQVPFEARFRTGIQLGLREISR